MNVAQAMTGESIGDSLMSSDALMASNFDSRGAFIMRFHLSWNGAMYIMVCYNIPNLAY